MSLGTDPVTLSWPPTFPLAFYNIGPPFFPSLCFVPFLIGLPPVWPGLCRYCWSQSEGPGPFPSIQPAVCPYPLTAPAGSQSEEIRSVAQTEELRLGAS